MRKFFYFFLTFSFCSVNATDGESFLNPATVVKFFKRLDVEEVDTLVKYFQNSRDEDGTAYSRNDLYWATAALKYLNNAEKALNTAGVMEGPAGEGRSEIIWERSRIELRNIREQARLRKHKLEELGRLGWLDNFSRVVLRVLCSDATEETLRYFLKPGKAIFAGIDRLIGGREYSNVDFGERHPLALIAVRGKLKKVGQPQPAGPVVPQPADPDAPQQMGMGVDAPQPVIPVKPNITALLADIRQAGAQRAVRAIDVPPELHQRQKEEEPKHRIYQVLENHFGDRMPDPNGVNAEDDNEESDFDGWDD